MIDGLSLRYILINYGYVPVDSKLSKIQDGQRCRLHVLLKSHSSPNLTISADQNQMVTEEAEKAEEERAAAQRYRENEARHKFKCDGKTLPLFVVLVGQTKYANTR